MDVGICLKLVLSGDLIFLMQGIFNMFTETSLKIEGKNNKKIYIVKKFPYISVENANVFIDYIHCVTILLLLISLKWKLYNRLYIYFLLYFNQMFTCKLYEPVQI